MTRKPLAALTALFACSTLVAACSVVDLEPIPTVDVGQTSSTQPIPVTYAQPAAAPQPLAPAATPAPQAQTPAPPVQTQMAAAAPSVAPAAATWGFPRVPVPGFGGRNDNAGMPAEEVQCRKRLKRLGVTFRDIPTIRDSASCGIDYPVEVSSLGRTIKLKPAATLNCAMAEEAARWAQRDLAPAARTRYLSGIAEVRQMSSYSCRKISGSRTFSEHSKGNALDIGAIKLKNGRVIDVAKPGLFAFRERSFLHRVRGQACGRFGTVLGPGYNRDHADHFHLDLKERRNVACH